MVHLESRRRNQQGINHLGVQGLSAASCSTDLCILKRHHSGLRSLCEEGGTKGEARVGGNQHSSDQHRSSGTVTTEVCHGDLFLPGHSVDLEIADSFLQKRRVRNNQFRLQ